MATLYNARRKSYTTLNNGGSLSSGAVSVTVTSAAALPSPPFLAYIDPGLINEELVAVTGVSTNTLTIVRGMDGTGGQTHSDGATVKVLMTSLAWNDLLSIFSAHSHTGADNSVMLPNYYPFKNAIPNGSLRVWQHGTSFASAASGTRLADNMIYFNSSGTAVMSFVQYPYLTSGPTLGANAPGTSFSINGGVVTADASVGAGEYILLRMGVEGYDYTPLMNGFTLSFWSCHTLTGTYCVAFQNGGQDRSYIAEYTQNSSNTWEYKTITVPSTVTTGTWNYTNGVGLYVFFPLMVGSTYQTTAGSWQTGMYFGSAAQVNVASSNTARYVNFSHINLIPGLIAEPLQVLPFSTELTRCQRYYQRLMEPGDFYLGTGQATSTTAGYVLKEFFVPMRAAPTVTVTNPTSPVAITSTFGANALATLSAANTTISNTRFGFTTTGLVAGNATAVAQFSGTCLVEASAEL